MKDTYFLDNMSSYSHIFLMHHLIEIHNQRINKEAIKQTQRKTGIGISL